MDVREVLDRLEAGKKTKTGYIARCPAHADQTASLSIAEGDDGRTLLNCFAGCPLDAVVAAMGITKADLFVDTPQKQGGSKITDTYDYVDENAELLFQVVRFEPKGFRQRRPDGPGKWEWKLGDTRRVLYRLPEVLEGAALGKAVFLVEGERDVHTLEGAGVLATCNPGGAGKWKPEYTEILRGASVVILPDNDDPGRQHAEVVASALQGIASEVRVLNLPGLPPKGDVSDWLASGGTREELERLVAEVEPETHSEDPRSGKNEGSTTSKKPSKAERAIGYAIESGAEFWSDQDGDPYADVWNDDGVRRTIRMRSRKFREWLSGLVYLKEGKGLGGQGATDAVDVLSAKALADGIEREVHVRIGEGPDGAVYLDLGDKTWRAIEVTSSGWEIVDHPPVRFRRPSALRPLPVPISGEGFKKLRKLLSFETESDRILVIAWLIGTLHPSGPFPILGLTGEHGTAKSTTGRILRSAVDPSEAPLRSPPRDDQALVVAARNGHIIGFDNLSRIEAWLSDALCRISTGGGYGARELYTDGEEVVFADCRPIIFTSIENVVYRGDLADRTIVVTLPVIPETSRRTEKALNAELDRIGPEILGALLDAMVVGLRTQETVELGRLPRMADFAEWIVACETKLPWEEGAFLKAYTAAQEEMVELGIESDLVASALVGFMEGREEWEGTSGELLDALNSQRAEDSDPPKSWPGSPRALSGRLTRVAPLLRQVGIGVEQANKRVKRLFRQTAEGSSMEEDEQHEVALDRPDRPSTISPQGDRDGTDGMDGSPSKCATSPMQTDLILEDTQNLGSKTRRRGNGEGPQGARGVEF